jgi:hypothetical protein
LFLASAGGSLNCQSHRSQRKLYQLKRDRFAAMAEPEPVDAPAIDPAATLIDLARDAVPPTATKGSARAQGLSGKQRRAARRIAENLARNKAEHARRQALARGPLQATG